MYDTPFSPFNPYGFPSVFNQQPNVMQPNTQPNVMQRPPQQSGPDWIMANTMQQVEQVQVAPGGKAWVMVQNEPVFALRTADNMGLVTTDYYRFEKIDPATAAPATEYVTRAEFEQFVQSLKPAKKKEGME